MRFNEIKQRLDPACWHNKKIGNPKTKMKGGVRVNNCVPAESVNESEYQELRKLQQQWWVALPAIMKKAGIDYRPVRELSRDYYPTLGSITIPGERFTTFEVNANPKGDSAKLNIHVDVNTSNEFYRTAQPERAAKLNAFAEKIAQALGGSAAKHITGERRNHPGVSHITATMTLPKEPEEWQNPSRGYNPRDRFLAQPGERARQARVARSANPGSFGGDASNYTRFNEQGVAEGTNDYFKRRKDEEDRIAGKKAPAKRTPRQTDYEKKRKEQGVAEGGFKNMYAEFSGYGNYMQGRAVNVFKKSGLEIVSKEYSEDDNIQTYVVKGDRWAIEKAGEFLERNPEQFGGYHFVKQGVAEDYNAEYDDEAGMAQGSLHTLKNAVEGLSEIIDSGDNLPEWCQEKISLAEDYLVTVWDYIQSEKAQGIDPEISEEFDMIERIIESIAAQNGVDAEAVWTDLESLTEDELYAFAVTSQLNEDWSKVNKRDKTDGMSQKAVNAYRRENPGSKLKTAVTTKPSKLKKGSKASKRRKSYCSRSKGQMNMHNISCAKTPDKAICKARRRWNC